MPTAHTVNTIYNGALDLIASHPVALSDSRAEVRWLNRNYAHYVQAALREDLWNFATDLYELSRNVADPPFRWARAYNLPNGWLRVVPPSYNGYRGGRPVPYEVKGNKLLTNWYGSGDTMNVELVMDVQSPGEWDALFANLIIARLGYGMAHAFTHKTSFKAEARQAAIDAYDRASQVNAFESPGDETEQHDIIRVRG